MEQSPIDPWRVMVCAAEHPSGARVFVLRGLPSRYEVTPAAPEELAWIASQPELFHGFLGDQLEPDPADAVIEAERRGRRMRRAAKGRRLAGA